MNRTACSQWRTHIVSKCVREESDEEIRICAIKYLPYLIYFLGVSSNSLVFKLIHPGLSEEKSSLVVKEYGQLLNSICCLISRKAVIIRKASFTVQTNAQNTSSSDEPKLELSDNFKLVCTFCDKKHIDKNLLSKLKRRKNLDLFQSLYNRPKHVDSQILMQFVKILANYHDEQYGNEIKSNLLKNLGRIFNHLEFGRQLNKQILVASDLNEDMSISNSATLLVKPNNQTNLTYIYKESINLLADISLDSLARFDFARHSIPKLICLNSTSIANKSDTKTAVSSLSPASSNEELISKAMSMSIFSLTSDSDPQLDHNFNFENQLCEGFLRAKSSKNHQDLYMYIICLGRFALSLKKCDEYMFLCVKHLLEIFDAEDSKDKWTQFASALAQRQLFILSKRINMAELLNEFEEKVCEIISDTVFNSIQRHQIYYSQLKQQQANQGSISALSNSTNFLSSSNTERSSYLQSANNSLKDVLRVFNVNDSLAFVKSYQRYLVAYLTYKVTLNENNHKVK